MRHVPGWVRLEGRMPEYRLAGIGVVVTLGFCVRFHPNRFWRATLVLSIGGRRAWLSVAGISRFRVLAHAPALGSAKAAPMA